MVSVTLVAGAAFAGVYNWASGVYSYNRDAWMTDIQVEQAHTYQEDNLRIQMQGMQREEVRDLVNSDINRINNSLLVATLILSLAGEMLFEGQIPPDCPAFVLNAYMLCLGSAVFHLSFSILFGLCASSKAYSRASRLLTRNIRPQWNEFFNKLKLREQTENTATFERRPLSTMMMPPLASRFYRSMRKTADHEAPGAPRPLAPKEGSPWQAWSQRTEASDYSPPPLRSKNRWRNRARSLTACTLDEASEFDSEMDLRNAEEANSPLPWHWHIQTWKDPKQDWVRFSNCMFKCVARGTMNLLEACGYLAVGTLYGGYANAWAFWAIQILFTVINLMIVYFLLCNFEPRRRSNPYHVWYMKHHPWATACIVASGPLFCAIAAATSVEIMDRFLIPLCYGTHTLVNINIVSMFASEEDVAETHNADSASETEAETPLPSARIVTRTDSQNVDLPVDMLRFGTYVVNFLWTCAFWWALYGSVFGMDFKNNKAMMPMWRSGPPMLEVSTLSMAMPSPYWKPHALICPRNQVFVADKYRVYELSHNNTQVKPVPCAVNGTVADITAMCDEQGCWPVVLLQGVPPMVLDCRTNRQFPLLQATGQAWRIATRSDGNSGVLRTLVATMEDKVIIQYDWSVGRNGWEPLWDVEKAKGVLALDLIGDRLLIFHRGGFLQVQDYKTGEACGTWALPNADSVLGGGCGNKDHSSILILVEKGQGTSLMRARLPYLDACSDNNFVKPPVQMPYAEHVT